MDPLGDHYTTCTTQMDLKLSIELEANSLCRFVANQRGNLGNSSVATWTQTPSDGQELIQTLETANFNISKYGMLYLKLQLNR